MQTLSLQEQTHTPDCKALFLGFMKLGLIGFGGVLPLAQHTIVDQQKWLNQHQFTNLLGICQILPGGNIINMAVAIGLQFQGIKGALSALIGLIFAPTLIVVLIYQTYAYFQQLVWVQHLIQGLAAAAAGLLFATGFKMLKPIIHHAMTLSTIILTFIFMVMIKLPLALTLIILLVINLLVLGVKQK